MARKPSIISGPGSPDYKPRVKHKTQPQREGWGPDLENYRGEKPATPANTIIPKKGTISLPVDERMTDQMKKDFFSSEYYKGRKGRK